MSGHHGVDILFLRVPHILSLICHPIIIFPVILWYVDAKVLREGRGRYYRLLVSDRLVMHLRLLMEVMLIIIYCCEASTSFTEGVVHIEIIRVEFLYIHGKCRSWIGSMILADIC